MKFFGFRRIQNHLFVTEHNNSVVHGCGESGKRIPRIKCSRFIEFELFSGNAGSKDVVSAVFMCVLGSNIAQATLIYLFIIMSMNVCEENVGLKFSVFCLQGHMDVGFMSSWSGQTSTCMCSLIRCRTLKL
jgi:hypothetical protein